MPPLYRLSRHCGLTSFFRAPALSPLAVCRTSGSPLNQDDLGLRHIYYYRFTSCSHRHAHCVFVTPFLPVFTVCTRTPPRCDFTGGFTPRAGATLISLRGRDLSAFRVPLRCTSLRYPVFALYDISRVRSASLLRFTLVSAHSFCCASRTLHCCVVFSVYHADSPLSPHFLRALGFCSRFCVLGLRLPAVLRTVLPLIHARLFACHLVCLRFLGQFVDRSSLCS